MKVRHKPDALGRQMKWVIELSEFDILYKSSPAINGQSFTNFLAEFTEVLKFEMAIETDDPSSLEPYWWMALQDRQAQKLG